MGVRPPNNKMDYAVSYIISGHAYRKNSKHKIRPKVSTAFCEHKHPNKIV